MVKMNINGIAGLAAFAVPVLLALGTLMTPPLAIPEAGIVLVIIGAIVGLLNVDSKERPWVAVLSALASGTFFAISTHLTAFDLIGRLIDTALVNLAIVLAPVAAITIIAELYEMLSKK